jgi:hypothetical protein
MPPTKINSVNHTVNYTVNHTVNYTVNYTTPSTTLHRQLHYTFNYTTPSTTLYRQLHYTVNYTVRSTTLHGQLHYTVNCTVNCTIDYKMPPQRKRNGIQDVDSAWTQITKISKSLKLSQRLTPGQSNRFKKVTESRGKEGLSTAALKHHTFLERVRDVDLNYYMLCTIAFSQYQIESTRAAILNDLVVRIRNNRNDASVISSSIRTLTEGLERHGTVRPPQAPEKWYVFTHAEVEGTREVFGESMMHKIKRVQMDKDWRAVTMRFPHTRTPEIPSSCSLSLEIREEDIKELAIALFKIEVNWATDAFQLAHENGTVQIIPHSEFTLKGVLGEDIVAVFEPEINSAITECPVRARELVEGKRRTDCVSMTFRRSEGTIILALGLERGVQIQGKLYNTNRT